MTEIRRRFEPTRGEKIWALDVATRLLWYALWNPNGKYRGETGAPDEVELQRAMRILEHMTNTLMRSRGTLRANRPGRKP